MYLTGFGNHHSSEAIPGALPQRQNSPQHCALGLYAEQLSGSAFTRLRHKNRSSWLYRVLPSVIHQDYVPYPRAINDPFAPIQSPNSLRWSPRPLAQIDHDFIDGLFHIAGNPLLQTYWYQCNQSMTNRYLSNSDGEFLILPYQGGLTVQTEFGLLTIYPGMFAVIPRGIAFKVELLDATAAGYVCENAGEPLTLPELGVIGANGLANPRHFLYPTAAVETPSEQNINLICKYQHHWWITNSDHSPLNVVAWHGNYAPYCYDLSLFNTINTVSFDHLDPSIFTVLTSASHTEGVANLDFAIFPSRWMVAEHTFRPPYFHRNIMSEFMGLISGEYDAKKEGFEVGGVSIHNVMTPHGPDAATYAAAIQQELKPEHYNNTLAFMFESNQPWQITQTALNHPSRQKDYSNCWKGLRS